MAVSSQNKERLPELLEKYKLSGDVNVRNEIVLINLDLVKVVAGTMRNIYIGYAETDDVVNEGVLALMAAIDGFDAGKGVKFETYASIKIKGAIIDYMRKLDRVPRQLRKLSKQLDETYARLHSEMGRAPENSELAEAMGFTEDQLSRLMANTAGMITLSFEELLYEDNLDKSMTGHGGNADSRMYEKEKKQVILDAIASLPEREKQVVTMYYYEKLKYTDIAKVLGITQSRVCQIHSKAMLALKTSLEDYIKG
ncbi:MAG: FliA/WhiG family RNA polymerase sigma factor [Ruminiclostridium sp.]|nr:FliA/WhiG family RNA polymerase sigma factor [Ruminiclostridium sp.]